MSAWIAYAAFCGLVIGFVVGLQVRDAQRRKAEQFASWMALHLFCPICAHGLTWGTRSCQNRECDYPLPRDWWEFPR